MLENRLVPGITFVKAAGNTKEEKEEMNTVNGKYSINLHNLLVTMFVAV